MLKATEAFQKVQKLNNELKNQVGTESQYVSQHGNYLTFCSIIQQEPLRQENQRIVSENNKLHLEVIKLKEELQFSNGDMRTTLKQLEGEKSDLLFLTAQKDKKIHELEGQVMQMRDKLQEALQTTQYKKSTEIQKIFSKGNDASDVSAQFSISNTLGQGEKLSG